MATNTTFAWIGVGPGIHFFSFSFLFSLFSLFSFHFKFVMSMDWGLIPDCHFIYLSFCSLSSRSGDYYFCWRTFSKFDSMCYIHRYFFFLCSFLSYMESVLYFIQFIKFQRCQAVSNELERRSTFERCLPVIILSN